MSGPQLHGAGMRVGIVWSRFNEEIVRELVTACDKQLVAARRGLRQHRCR